MPSAGIESMFFVSLTPGSVSGISTATRVFRASVSLLLAQEACAARTLVQQAQRQVPG